MCMPINCTHNQAAWANTLANKPEKVFNSLASTPLEKVLSNSNLSNNPYKTTNTKVHTTHTNAPAMPSLVSLSGVGGKLHVPKRVKQTEGDDRDVVGAITSPWTAAYMATILHSTGPYKTKMYST